MGERKLNTGSGFLVLALALILPATSDVTSSYVTLTRDGYQNVVVSIEENSGFSDCQEGLEAVKELIRKTSTSFGRALERPAYFGNVTIIIPDSWAAASFCSSLLTSANASDLPWARSHRADIRITPDHPVFGWQPHSFQYGGCQQSGLPINVPSSFVTSGTVLAKGMRMAREWAHYRYGVFDEGGMPNDQRHPSGYLMFQTESSDKILRSNTCSDLKTPSGNWNSENCKSASTADSACEFVADVSNPDILSSLMYRPDLDHMEKFCTKENHDDGVPSKLSYHCGSLSASEVIYKHSDFNPAVTPANSSAITFNVIQNPFSGHHVVFDIASFKDSKSFETARSSLLQFVGFFSGSVQLSVDVYNGYNVTELQPPIVLDYNAKEELLTKMAILEYVGSGSSDKFGDALSRAQSRANDGQDVVILTSAPTFPSLSTWAKSYEENKVNAHLVYFGASTTKVDAAQLARYGSANFMPNVVNSNQTSAYSWAVNTLQSVYGKTTTHRAKIFEQTVIQNSNSDLNKTGSFYLDSPASKLLVSLYCLDASNAFNVQSFVLTQPSGVRNETTANATIFDDFYEFTMESVLEPLPKGLWLFEILFQKTLIGVSTKRLDVWAESANLPQIQLRAWNSAMDNQPLDFTEAPVGLYAQLTLDSRPIRGANVTALVYASESGGSTSSLLAEIPLMDEGISDVTSGDGIYSGFMTKPSNSSFSYSVYYRAYGVNSLAQVDNGVYSRQPTTGSVIPMSDPVPAATQFNRFEYGPGFQLTTVPTNGFDQIPPQRVTDLTIISYDSLNRTAVLGWTASKDNYGTGDFVTHYRLERTIGTRETIRTEYPSLSAVDGTVYLPVQVPSVNEGEYVKYRVQGRDSSLSLNYGEMSNVVSLARPAPPTGGLSTAGMWAIIGTFIALVVIILVVVLIRCCCPVSAKRRRRQAQRKIRQLFSSGDQATRRVEDTPVTRYQAPQPFVQQWESPAVSRDGAGPPAARRESVSSDERQQPQVEVRQKKTNPASIQGSERIYFGQEDVDRMTLGHRSETYSERGTEEMIKRAPSMDLQLATILRMNSSNMSMDRAGLEGDYDEPQPNGPTNPGAQQRQYKANPAASRPVSSQVTSKGFSYIYPNKPISQSETNLYYTDVALRPPVGQSTKSSPSNSYFSVYAERADALPQQHPSSAQSSLANTLRAGMRSNEEWQDSNSFIYTDPRFEGQSNGQSSFDPQLHPANQVGLPPALPTSGPPLLRPRTQNTDADYDYVDPRGADPQTMSRSSSKPSLVSAV